MTSSARARKEGEEPIPTVGIPDKPKGPPVNAAKWPIPLQNANLSEGQWQGSHMGSPLFATATMGAAQALHWGAACLWSTKEHVFAGGLVSGLAEAAQRGQGAPAGLLLS